MKGSRFLAPAALFLLVTLFPLGPSIPSAAPQSALAGNRPVQERGLITYLPAAPRPAENAAGDKAEPTADDWFSDDFNDGIIDPVHWQVSGDGVSEAGGVLSIFRDAADDSLATISTYDPDFEIIVDIRATQMQWQDMMHGMSVKTDDNYGISFGFSMYGTFFLAQHEGPGTSFDYFGPYELNQWYQWHLVKTGTTIDVYVDGSWTCSGDVPAGSRVSFPGYYNDGGSGTGSSSEIDNFSISPGQLPEVAFSSTTYFVAEDTPSGVAVITVTLSEASSQTVAVDYETIDGTALAGEDYVTTSGTLTFTAGQLSGTFLVPIIDDTDGEGDESLGLALSNPLSVVLGFPNEAVLTIWDDDSPQLRVVATDPLQYELQVSRSSDVSGTFNIEVDGSTVNDSSFLLFGAQSGHHAGAVSYDDGTWTALIDPVVDFGPGETVTALLTKAIRATSGVYLKGFAWDFVVEIPTPSDGTFTNRVDYTTGGEPRGLYAGDLDADGDIDLALTSNPNAIFVHLNDGSGTFLPPSSYNLSAGDPMELWGADLDGDGDTDLAVAHNEPGTSHLSILKNNGDASFTLYATYAPAILGSGIAGGDLDGDGDVDLVMTDGWGASSNVKVMLNQGDGSFSGPYTYSAESWADAVVAVDVDNDGDRDILVANEGSSRVCILLNDGNGGFIYVAGFPVGDVPTALYAGDLNGDGWVDLATANYSSSDIGVILNNGNGTFTDPTNYPAGSNPRGISGGDFDGDGDIDLVSSNAGDASLFVILNNGDGTFANPATYAVGTSPWGVQAADIDLDGDMDLACANTQADTISIWFNSGLPPAVPGLAVDKAAEPGLILTGERLTYTIRVSNTGDVTLTAIVTDVLPAQVVPGGVLTWTPTIAAPAGVWQESVVVTTVMGYVGPLTNVVWVDTEEGASGVYTHVAYVSDIPISGLTASNDSPTALGDPTTLSASVAAGSNVSYSWELGDGTLGAGPVVTHTYPSVGSYAAVVTASNSAGLLTATTIAIVEEAIAGLQALNDSPTVLGNPTTLSATLTAGSNVSYSWRLGDGTWGAGPVVTHTYPSVGSYAAVVTASNSVGLLTATTIVVVEEAIAGLQAFNDSPTVLGNPTTLSATITAGSNVSFTWAFGDGTFGTGPILSHSYPAALTYTAVVTATNSVSAMTATTVVTVTGRAYFIYLPLVLRNH